MAIWRVTMPLMKGKSSKAFSHNVEAEMNAGKSQKQSLAIAYAVKRKGKKYAKGGMVSKKDTYGPQEQITADDHFLSAEDADNSPFQEASEQSGDDVQLEESGQQIHPALDNQKDNEDENQARKDMIAQIMRKVRRR